MSADQLSPQTALAAREFAARVASAFPTRSVLLFGSRARGTAHDESDADIAVVLTGDTGHFVRTKMAMNDIAYDILLDTGIRIQPLPVWEGQWLRPNDYSNPELLRNIARDGVRLQ